MPELTDAEIIELYNQGKSLRDIAAVMGVSTRRPQRVVRNAGKSRVYGGSGPEHSQWKGGRLPASEGYWRVWLKADDPMESMRNHQGYVLEHRLVMARTLGRPLLPSETVHHIDGDRENNHPDNLQLRQGKHGKNIVMCCADCGSSNIVPTRLAEEV